MIAVGSRINNVFLISIVLLVATLQVLAVRFFINAQLIKNGGCPLLSE